MSVVHPRVGPMTLPSPSPAPSATSSTTAAAGSGGFDVGTLLLGPAVTAALVAGVFLVIQIFILGRRERNQKAFEFRLRQANELYAPVLLLLAEDHALIGKLREAAAQPGIDWHLLDNLRRVRKDKHLMPVAERIVEVNLAIKDVLMKHAGLVLGDLPPSFRDFISHADLVRDAVSTGTVPKNVGLRYFPKQFEKDVQAKYSDLVKSIKSSLGDS